MTPAYGAASAAPTRLTFVHMALWALPVMALLLYSGGWELPLVGENATEAGSAILRVGYLPAYAAGFALIALRPGSTLRVVVTGTNTAGNSSLAPLALSAQVMVFLSMLRSWSTSIWPPSPPPWRGS